MNSLKTLTLKNILINNIHYNNYNKLFINNNILIIKKYNYNLISIISNLYNFYKIIYYLNLNNIRFIFIYTFKNKYIKNLIKKISELTLNFYFLSSWKSGLFTNKTTINKKIILIKSIILFKKLLIKKYIKTKNIKLLKIILKLKSKLNKKLTTTKCLINKNILNSNFLIFLSPKKDIKIIKEAYLTNKIIIIFEQIKSKFSDFSITYLDNINKSKLLFYFSLFCSI